MKLPLTPLTNCKCLDVVTRSSIRKTRKLAGINANANITHMAVNISIVILVWSSLSISIVVCGNG
jgi:hypothetical protein